MVAPSARLTEIQETAGEERLASGDTRWKLAGTFATVELAERLMSQLEAQGTPCVLSLIGGLSVIAQQQQ